MAPAAPAPAAAPTQPNDNDNNNKTSSPQQQLQQQQQQQQQQQHIIYNNPHWKGYSYLFVCSLINLSATTNVPQTTDYNKVANIALYQGNWGVAASFGAATLCVVASLLVLLVSSPLDDNHHHRMKQCCCCCLTAATTDTDNGRNNNKNKFNYTSTAWRKGGRLEGAVLVTLSLYWIVGVAYLTQVQGIAYTVSNIYFSAWLCLAAALYTLNHWSTKQDILSWAELTSVSATLKSWYILCLGSFVVLGTSINYYYFLLSSNHSNNNPYNDYLLSQEEELERDQRSASMVGMVLGSGSSLISLVFILTHYRLIQPCATGGWAELMGALFVTLCWIVGCSVLTQEGAIGATIVGRGCSSPFWALLQQQLQYEYEQQGESSNNNSSSSSSSSYDDPVDVTADLWDWVGQSLEEDGTTTGASFLCEVQILTTTEMNDINATTTMIKLVNVTVPCDSLAETTLPTVEFVPGSNLYLSVWTCMAASIHLLLRWKAQQALQFAQAQQESRMRRDGKDGAAAAAADGGDDDDFDENGNSSRFLGDDYDDEDDNDLDEFVDAADR